MIPRARPRVDAMKRGRRENENGGRGDGYTQGGNVLINGRAPPLPRGRINIFGCSNACKKAVERERERERWIHADGGGQNMLRHELPQEHRRISFIITWGPSIHA